MTYREKEILLRIAPRRKVAEDWALVLLTQGISAHVRHTRGGFALGVRAEEARRAETALAAHDGESREEVRAEEKPAGSGYLVAGLAVPVTLLVFFFLTLHANFLHVMVNAIMGAVFLSASFRLLGAGLGGALVLLAGAGGNFLNALLHGAPHNAVGASTALFGAVGALGGLGVVRKRRAEARGRRAWAPFAAGLALLALMGTAGQRVDIWAHLLGFLLGSVLGILAGIPFPRPPAVRVQWSLGSAALATVVWSWMLALR
jgi:hypothetical protein